MHTDLVDPPFQRGGWMAQEIDEQPAVIARVLDNVEAIRGVQAALLRRGPTFLLFAGRGTSGNAARYGRHLAEVRLGIPGGTTSTSTTSLYGSRPRLESAAFIAVSQSGASPDLLESLQAASTCGALTIAVTNNTESPLARAADLHIPLHAGPELAVAATKTYLAQLLTMFLLFSPALSAAERIALDALPDTAAGALAITGPYAAAAAPRYRFATRLLVVGRGYSYLTAREAALKMMETSYLSAQAFSSAEVRHGPIAAVDATTPVVAVLQPGRAGASTRHLIDDLRGLGADVLEVGGSELPLQQIALPETLRPMIDILPLQQLALQVALGRGENPDQPRNLAKITSTV